MVNSQVAYLMRVGVLLAFFINLLKLQIELNEFLVSKPSMKFKNECVFYDSDLARSEISTNTE